MSVSAPDSGHAWPFFRFGLIVTGEGEEEFLPSLFRSLAATGRCSFRVIRRIRQRSPIQSQRRRLRMMGSSKQIPTRDDEEIGLQEEGPKSRRSMVNGAGGWITSRE